MASEKDIQGALMLAVHTLRAWGEQLRKINGEEAAKVYFDDSEVIATNLDALAAGPALRERVAALEGALERAEAISPAEPNKQTQ